MEERQVDIMPADSATLPSAPPSKMAWLREAASISLRDPALIYGFKFGLAGILAVFLALLIRMQNPTWALFTVFVLMIAQYVGAIGEKSFFRLIGTAVGGLIGYVLTASFEQQPTLFLILIGLVVAFCTAMFGQSRYPYAFLLCGLTTIVVVSNGLGNPDMSWQYMLWRVEEVGIGVIATVLVQSVIWPRYARIVFAESAQSACADLRDCLIASGEVFLKNTQNTAAARAEEFPARINGLRALLDFGARESQFFRSRINTYFEITTCLSRIASATVTLGEELPQASVYRDALGDELEKLHHTLENALDDLSKSATSPKTRAAHRQQIDDAFSLVEDQFSVLRSDERYFKISPEEAMIIGTHILALDDIRHAIYRLHELLDSLPADPTDLRTHVPDFISPIPSPFWIRTGIKSAAAVTIALLIDNWFHPPGSAMFILGAWVFTALNATSPGGQGDRRTFHYLVYSALVLLFFSIVLLLTTPMLSSYAVMNVVLFTWLFLWGYLSFQTRGVTIPMQMGMLAAVGLLGLNAQVPVQFQSIADLFFGIVTGQALAAIIQRVFWPSLPQFELRNRLLEYLHICALVIQDGTDSLPVWKKARLALIPGESVQRIGLLHPPICPEGEQKLLIDYLHSLQRVGSHLFVTIGRLIPALPEEHKTCGRELGDRMETSILKHLKAHEISLKTLKPLQTDDTELQTILADIRTWVAAVRNWTRENNHPVLASGRILGLVGRYEQSCEDLILAGQRARKLSLPLYMGDYVL